MKEITVEPLLDEHFKKKETCTMPELYHLVEDYRKKHPDVYVQYDRDYLHYVLGLRLDKYYWNNREGVIYKQHEIKCPCCEAKISLYPEQTKYMNVLAFIKENDNGKDD